MRTIYLLLNFLQTQNIHTDGKLTLVNTLTINCVIRIQSDLQMQVKSYLTNL